MGRGGISEKKNLAVFCENLGEEVKEQDCGRKGGRDGRKEGESNQEIRKHAQDHCLTASGMRPLSFVSSAC